MGGLCIRTASMIDAAAVQIIRFRLGRHDLEFRVRWRWSSAIPSGEGRFTGFAFEDLDATSEKALWSFIQERAHEVATFLRSCGGLSHLDFQDALELALTTRIREFECGAIVYGRAGDDPSGSLFALFRGSILLKRVGERRNQEIDIVQPGEFFGGMPTIAGCKPLERAVATSTSTVLEFTECITRCVQNTKPQLGTMLIRAASFDWMQRTARLLDRLYDKEMRACSDD